MAFGQAAGPPASAKQLAQLAELLADAGYDSFREARHPFGLTQRQSNGMFTRDEASELLSRLEDGRLEDGRLEDGGAAQDEAPEEPGPARPVPRPGRAPARAPDRADRRAAEGADAIVTAFPDELLAEELARRGWTCLPPS